jgi:hypothetical protein
MGPIAILCRYLTCVTSWLLRLCRNAWAFSLTVTDTYRLENGHILLSAVAEATADSYADGTLVGAAIVELDAAFDVRAIKPLELVLKVVGLSARVEANGVHIYFADRRR